MGNWLEYHWQKYINFDELFQKRFYNRETIPFLRISPLHCKAESPSTLSWLAVILELRKVLIILVAAPQLFIFYKISFFYVFIIFLVTSEILYPEILDCLNLRRLISYLLEELPSWLYEEDDPRSYFMPVNELKYTGMKHACFITYEDKYYTINIYHNIHQMFLPYISCMK